MEIIFMLFVIAIVVIIVKVFRSKPDEQFQEQTKSTDQVLVDANRMLLLMEVMRQAKEHNDTATMQEVNKMTYDGPLPELLPDGSYTSLYEEELSFNIAGINYREGIAAYVGKFDGYLQPDTQNEYDPNAIAVYHSDGHHLGFIPAYETQEVRELNLPFPIEVTGFIEQKHNEAEKRDYFQGVVYVDVK